MDEEEKLNLSDEVFKEHKIKKKIKTEGISLLQKESLVSEAKPQEILVPSLLQPTQNNPMNFQIQEENPVGFYGQKKNITMQERTHYLATSDLRKFNNWIKSVLISTYTQKTQSFLNDKKCLGKLSILEIGCGKGGDLPKWAHHKIGSFIGIDVVQESLDEAKKRYSENNKDLFKAQFIELGGEAEQSKFLSYFDENLFFDIISCQFSLHYMFDSEQNALNLFKNMAAKIVDKGFVLITIPDANVIVKRLRYHGRKIASGDIVIGNDYYSIKINDLKFPKKKVYGLKYGFYLEDAVGEKKQISEDDPILTYVPEYLIEFKNFVDLAKKFNFELVEEKNFLDYYQENRVKFKELFSRMKLNYKENEGMNKQLWDISHLYKVVVLQKQGGANIANIQRNYGELKQNYYTVEEKEKNF